MTSACSERIEMRLRGFERNALLMEPRTLIGPWQMLSRRLVHFREGAT